MTPLASPARIPVTIVTGFLGSGKTTLLNRILSELPGGRVAVIENEFGEVGIDNALLVQDGNEQIVEMNNGCICCTVRGDLLRILTSLAGRRRCGELKFERVVIETTGLADPGPVAQTFFADESIQSQFALDAIITLADARHIDGQLDGHHEAQAQIGFADRILLSKTDRVTMDETVRVIARLRQINARAPIERVHFGAAPLANILDIRSFDLDTALELQPDFLGHRHHHHSDDIASFVYRSDSPMDLERIEGFFGPIVEIYGPAMLRYKGVLNIAGLEQRTVFQGVHAIFEAHAGRSWQPDEARETRIVFIGKQLPFDLIRHGLDRCAVPSHA